MADYKKSLEAMWEADQKLLMPESYNIYDYEKVIDNSGIVEYVPIMRTFISSSPLELPKEYQHTPTVSGVGSPIRSEEEGREAYKLIKAEKPIKGVFSEPHPDSWEVFGCQCGQCTEKRKPFKDPTQVHNDRLRRKNKRKTRKLIAKVRRPSKAGLSIAHHLQKYAHLCPFCKPVKSPVRVWIPRAMRPTESADLERFSAFASFGVGVVGNHPTYTLWIQREREVAQKAQRRIRSSQWPVCSVHGPLVLIFVPFGRWHKRGYWVCQANNTLF